MLLLVATARSVVKSVKVPVVEVVLMHEFDLTGFRHRSSGDKSVGCLLQGEHVSHILWCSSTVCTDIAWFSEHPMLVGLQ